MNLTTRPATSSDTEFARRTHHAAYRDLVVAQFGAWDETLQDGFFDRDWRGGTFEVLLYDGQPCGYACVDEQPTHVHLRELVIHPTFQRRGIGTTFLRRVMTSAQAKGLPVQLGTAHQNRALVLYRRLGFREFDRTDTHVLLEWASE